MHIPLAYMPKYYLLLVIPRLLLFLSPSNFKAQGIVCNSVVSHVFGQGAEQASHMKMN